MQKKHRSASNKYSIFRRAACLFLIVAISILFTFLPGLANAHNTHIYDAPGGNIADPAIRGTDLALPSVVRILTGVQGHLKVHFPQQSSDISFPQQSSKGYNIQLSGTGTFITAHGDILTADHVIRPPADNELKTALYQAAATDIANTLNHSAQKQSGASVSSQSVVQQLTGGQLQSTATFDSPLSTVYLSTAYTGLTHASDTTALPNGTIYNVDRIEKESPPSQQDTAIIHIPLDDSLSTPVGDSSSVQAQDTLTTIGYPGNSDIGNAPDSLLTPSVNQIYVNAQKTNQNGAPLIQITGNVSQGDSGGPALNKQGNIVGIVSFGVVSQTGSNNTSFLQASSSAQKMIQDAKLDTTPGQQQKLWSQAIASYAATTPGHWHQAEQEFAQLLQKYPAFKAAQQYHDYAQSQAKSETGIAATPVPARHVAPGKIPATTAFSWQALAFTILSIIVLLLLMVGMFGTAVRQKKKSAYHKASSRTTEATSGKEVNSDVAPSRPVSISTSNTPQPGAGAQDTLALKIWPCGHMNRPNARFCSVCGEPAPEAGM